jgi:hypothetical protein
VSRFWLVNVAAALIPRLFEHPPKTWTAFPEAKEVRGSGTGSFVLDLQTNVITLPPADDKKI